MEIVDGQLPDEPAFDAEYQRLAQSESPYEARIGEMMLTLIDRLRNDVVGPRLLVTYFIDELHLDYYHGREHKTTIRVTVDHPDYGPLEDGLPRFHYRLRYDLPPPHSSTTPETVDERTHDVATACDIVREAISKSKPVP